MLKRQDDPHRQLLLFESGTPQPTGGESRLDVSFLHKSFCVAGLPLRRPRETMEVYSRNDDRFALTIHPHKIILPGGAPCEIGVPWGAKGRLLIMWANTEVKDPARRQDDRWLEIGRIKEWMAQVGIKINGLNIAATKDQLIRLAFSQFTMVLRDAASTLFKADRLIEGGVFPDDDLVHYARGEMDKVRWPLGLELSQKAFERFSNNAIPVPTARLAEVSNSAMAIDIFMFLCYRLPLLGQQESQMVPWRDLIAQFGNREAPSKFRDTFNASIKAALRAYPEAKVDLTHEGLVLHYSDPAELRRAFVAVRRPAIEKRRRQLRNRTAKPGEDNAALA
jgi:hypothetical protein